MTGPLRPASFVDLSAVLEDEIVSAEQIDAELAGEKPVPRFDADGITLPDVKRNAVTIAVPRAMLLDLGLVEPTPEEAEQRDRELAEHRQRVREAWALYDTAKQALDALDTLVARAVLDLHAPEELSGSLKCDGCDADGYDIEAPAWPCRTVQAVAQVHGIALPDSLLLSFERDCDRGEWVRPA